MLVVLGGFKEFLSSTNDSSMRLEYGEMLDNGEILEYGEMLEDGEILEYGDVNVYAS
jgi:hypothetical protein